MFCICPAGLRRIDLLSQVYLDLRANEDSIIYMYSCIKKPSPDFSQNDQRDVRSERSWWPGEIGSYGCRARSYFDRTVLLKCVLRLSCCATRFDRRVHLYYSVINRTYLSSTGIFLTRYFGLSAVPDSDKHVTHPLNVVPQSEVFPDTQRPHAYNIFISNIHRGCPGLFCAGSRAARNTRKLILIYLFVYFLEMTECSDQHRS